MSFCTLPDYSFFLKLQGGPCTAVLCLACARKTVFRDCVCRACSGLREYHDTDAQPLSSPRKCIVLQKVCWNCVVHNTRLWSDTPHHHENAGILSAQRRGAGIALRAGQGATARVLVPVPEQCLQWAQEAQWRRDQKNTKLRTHRRAKRWSCVECIARHWYCVTRNTIWFYTHTCHKTQTDTNRHRINNAD